MVEASQFMKSWKVRHIEVLPDNRGVEVEFGVEGRDPVRFRTKRFGIGRRGARSAALAKFASQAGFGEAEDLFHLIVSLPRKTVGRILWPGILTLTADTELPQTLGCVWPDEASC
jgi:hypothetical protein